MLDLRRQTLLVALLFTVVGGCEAAPSSHQAPSKSQELTSQTANAVAAGTAAPSASAMATDSVPSPGSRFAGNWTGSYIARRGEVTIPRGASDKPWRQDKGKRAQGEGTIRLNVHPDGAVTGSGKGALGSLIIRGAVDKETLRAGVTASAAAEPEQMTGTLVGRVVGERIDGQLRVANASGNIVRVANPKFKRLGPSGKAD